MLRNIAALARPALLDSLIDLYLQHSPALDRSGRERRPRPCSPTRSPTRVHTLNSSTANLGGTRLASRAKECEVLVRNGGVARARAARARGMRKEYQDFCAAIAPRAVGGCGLSGDGGRITREATADDDRHGADRR